MYHRDLTLYWLDKNWKQRGVAHNFVLGVDMDAQVYATVTTCAIPQNRTSIEVVRKSDITDYIKYLDAIGYKRVNSSEM